MFRDFEKSPSKSSYQLKFLLAGLTFLALIGSWFAGSSSDKAIHQLRADNDAVGANFLSASSKLETAEAGLSAAKAELLQKETDIESVRGELEALRGELDAASATATADASAKTDEIAALQTEIAALKENLTQVTS